MCGEQVGIVASGDAGWQGAGSYNKYNSISGHTLLVGDYMKLVLVFKFPKHAVVYKRIMVQILM